MNTDELTRTAALVRSDILKMTTLAGSGHPGGSMSAADIMTVLYFADLLRYDAARPDWPERDRFILSKGHVAPVLYSVMARAGYFELSELTTLRRLNSRLQGHPDMRKLPGVEVSTGSLGQGLSIAAGLAYGLRSAWQANQAQSDSPSRLANVFTLLGDGECQEGQVWEAAMFAAHQKLANLIAIVDNNGLQIDGRLDQVVDVGSLEAKFGQFGWQTFAVDGHDINALIEVINAALATDVQAPRAIIAKTVKGQGVSFMAGQVAWHGKSLDEDQLAQALAELSPLIGDTLPDEDWDTNTIYRGAI